MHLHLLELTQPNPKLNNKHTKKTLGWVRLDNQNFSLHRLAYDEAG